MKDSVQLHSNNPLKIVPNTHSYTPKLIVAKPAPTKRKHCKRYRSMFFFYFLKIKYNL